MSVKPPIPQKPPIPGKQLPAVAYVPPWESGQAGPIPRDDEETQAAYDFSHLTTKHMAIRQLFVVEFVKDFNPHKAMLRMGFEKDYATAYRWLNEPYTQYCLDKFIREAKDEALITRAAILAGLVREANNHGPDCSGASRTSAYKTLCKVMGMEITKVQVDTVAPGVMFIPMMGTPEQWGSMAAAAQEKLKSGAAA